LLFFSRSAFPRLFCIIDTQTGRIKAQLAITAAERKFSMIEFTCQIKDPNGMHARPAGRLVTFAKQFKSEIRVSAGGKTGDAKRLLSLMSLGASSGATLTFTVSGEDEEGAAAELRAFVAKSLGGEA
jgi:phosphocarrier protein